MLLQKLSLLTFPQMYQAGKIEFNILIIPRNFNPLLPFDPGHPPFAEAILNFRAFIINSPEGLPVITNVTDELVVTLANPPVVTTAIWEALRKQIKASDGLTIDDPESADQNQKSDSATMKNYQKVSIRKHLPETYTSAFNFTKARTRFATTGDEYGCAVQNNRTPADKGTRRDTISWGKVVAMVLRNPLLAEKAGLIYKATISLTSILFDEGGWLYTDFGVGSDYETLNKDLVCKYAARIPALKKLSKRILFSPFNSLF